MHETGGKDGELLEARVAFNAIFLPPYLSAHLQHKTWRQKDFLKVLRHQTA